MGKSQKKQASKQPKLKVKELTPEVIEQQKGDVDKLEDTILDVTNGEELVEAELKDSEKKAADDLVATNDSAKYLERLMSLHRMLLAAKNKYEELQKSTKEEADKNNKNYQERSDALKQNELAVEQEKKEIAKQKQDIQRREVAMSDKLYTDVILNLLDSFKETEETVTKATAERIKELSEHQQDILKAFLEQLKKEEDLSSREAILVAEKENLKSEKEQFEKKKNRDNSSLELQKAELRDEIEDEYLDKIDELTSSNKQYEIDNKRLQKDFDRLNSTINDLWNLSGNVDANEILKQFRATQEELRKAKNEIESRPSMDEYQKKNEQVQILTAKVEELQNKVNEEELVKLREKLSNENYYIQEINSFHSQIDTLNANIEHKDMLINQLQSVISQLRGEDGKQKKAFEFATSIDESEGYKEYLRSNSQIAGYSLKDMVQYLRSYMFTNEGYSYDDKTIRIFLAGLHMSPLSILQGISGTGKTSLPREVAKAMVAGSPKYQNFDMGMPSAPYRICAIQSGWRDRMDLVGYFNHFDKKYQETEFFRALYIASQPKYKNTLFFIVLDEMNLSHPEHYFADFLSLLEQDEKDRYINVDAPYEFMPESISKNGKMKIPANVRFIGTANHDETTLGFAPKTCDRSNLMDICRSKNEPIRRTSEKLTFTYDWIAKQFKDAEERYDSEYNKFVKFLTDSEVEEIFANIGVGIGKRLESQAKRFITVYIASGSDSKEDSLSVAADHLITSRLLRNIENKLDLKAATLKEFKENLILYFSTYFKGEPKMAIDVLNKAIDKQ